MRTVKNNIYRFCLFVFCLVAVFGVSFNSMEAKAAAGGSMKLHALYLSDHGDCVLLESRGEYMLMDLGMYTNYSDIRNYLKGQGITKLSVYFSHFDPDHTGGNGGPISGNQYGISNLMNDFTVTRVYMQDPSLCPKFNLSEYQERLKKLYLQEYGDAAVSNLIYLKVGSSFNIGDANVQIIGPVGVNSLKQGGTGDDGEDDYVNNTSLVAMITCGNTRYLATGDCKDDEEKQLIKKYGTAGLKADIYKMAHHGMAPANSEEFIECVQPKYSFAQNGGDDVLMNIPYNDGEGGNSVHRRTHAARTNCSAYGFCYMVGDEKKPLIIDVTNDKISLYGQGNSTPLNSPNTWAKVVGGDGVYKLYDYYYFGSDAKPVTGVQTIGGKTYYFGTGGCRETGKYYTKNGKKVYRPWQYYGKVSGKNLSRYFNEKTEEVYVGIHKIDGKYYYFEPDTALLRFGDSKGSKQKIGKYYYAIFPSGAFATNCWKKYSKGSCYFGSDGRMKTGWQKINSKKYYLDPETGYRLTGVQQIDGKVYVFNAYGMLNTNKTIQIGGKVYKTSSNGALKGVPKVSSVTLKKVSAGKKKATVTLNRNKKVDGYEVYYATSKNGTYKTGAVVKKNSTTKAVVKNLKSGKTYYIKVRGYKKFGDGKIYSKYSSAKKVKVK